MPVRYLSPKGLTRLLFCGLVLLFEVSIAIPVHAQGLPGRDDVLTLMNRNAPFFHERDIMICDVSELKTSGFSRQIQNIGTKDIDLSLLRHCRLPESLSRSSHNAASDVVGVFFNTESHAILVKHLGEIGVSSFFGGYDHSYYYWSAVPESLARTYPDFASVEGAQEPFSRLHLKSFGYRIGAVTGVRRPSTFGPEGKCNAIADYRFEIVEQAPWAQIFTSRDSEYWNGMHSACLTEYDDGWRITAWRVDQE